MTTRRSVGKQCRRWWPVLACALVPGSAAAAPQAGLPDWHLISEYQPYEQLYRLGRVVGKKVNGVDTRAPSLVGNGVLVGEDLVLTCGHVWGSDAISDGSGLRGFAFDRESEPGGSFGEPDIYAATEVVFHEYDTTYGHDLALVRVEGRPGRKYGWARMSHWNPGATVPATNVLNDYEGQDKAATPDCTVTPDDEFFGGDVLYKVCPEGPVSGSGSGLFLDDGRLIGIRCGTLNPAVWRAMARAAENDVYLGYGPDTTAQSDASFDFDGDGFSDMIYSEDPYDQPNGWYNRVSVLRSDGGEFLPPEIWSGDVGSPGETVLVGNFDGDAAQTDDVLVVRQFHSGQIWYQVATSDTTALSSASLWKWMNGADDSLFFAGDFSGGGRSDVLRLEPNGAGGLRARLSVSTGSGFANEVTAAEDVGSPGDRFYVGDFDGDGRTDLLRGEVGGGWADWMVLASTGAAQAPELGAAVEWLSHSHDPDHRFLAADLDGNGAADLVRIRKGVPIFAPLTEPLVDVDVHLSDGTSFDPSDDWLGQPGWRSDRFFARDVDNDGDDDLVRAFEYNGFDTLEDMPVLWHVATSDLPNWFQTTFFDGLGGEIDDVANVSDFVY